MDHLSDEGVLDSEAEDAVPQFEVSAAEDGEGDEGHAAGGAHVQDEDGDEGKGLGLLFESPGGMVSRPSGEWPHLWETVVPVSPLVTGTSGSAAAAGGADEALTELLQWCVALGAPGPCRPLSDRHTPAPAHGTQKATGNAPGTAHGVHGVEYPLPPPVPNECVVQLPSGRLGPHEFGPAFMY